MDLKMGHYTIQQVIMLRLHGTTISHGRNLFNYANLSFIDKAACINTYDYMGLAKMDKVINSLIPCAPNIIHK